MIPKYALAQIQPWHPGMMYIVYALVSEEQMLEHRVDNQPVPAASRDVRLEPREALLELRARADWWSKSRLEKQDQIGGARADWWSSISVLFRASRPSRARAGRRARARHRVR